MSTKIEKIIENMSLDELVGQLMCYNVPMSESEDIATAQICRSNGMHWSFAPVVDINYIDMSTIVEKSI